MEKSIAVFSSFDEMKAAELREWQSLPGYERLGAASEMTLAFYGVEESDEDVRRIQRTLVHLQREKR